MLVAALALAVLLPAGRPAAAQAAAPPAADPVQLALRARFPASGAPPRLALEGESFRASPDLACFYRGRGHAPAWSTAERLLPAAGELLAALADTAGDGLRPDDDYRLPALRRAVASAGRTRPDLDGRTDLDLLLSNAFLTAAAHLRDGKVNPEAVYSDCALAHDAGDLSQVLEAALAAGGPKKVRAALAGLEPPQPAYARLKEALLRYRGLAAVTGGSGGVPPVPAGPTLKAGDRGERVAALRARLAEAAAADAAPPLRPHTGEAALFDGSLEEALRHFQERHGLEPDGAAGKATLAELNLDPADHVRQIEVNLERWRWLPQDLGRRHLLVNIAAFHLDAVEDGRTALAMRVIVGKPFTRTPMFSSAVDGVVLNPSWYVPESIARKEIFPKAAKDPSYLARENFEVLPGRKLRQRPGPGNALGRIKLSFPNRFGVYLHDTPTPALFGRTVRTFSHGCIRLEKPFDLAAWLLRDEPAWTPAAIKAGIDAGRERTVPVSPKVPVHVAYWTAWVGDDGTLHLGRDVYGRDAGLARLLAGKKAGG